MPTCFQHHPASFPHPRSLIALIPLSVVTMRNKKKCSFRLQLPTPPIIVSSYFIFSTHISLLILVATLTYSACTPANGFHRMCFNLVLPTTFHPGNRLPGFSIQINRNGIQFAKNTFCVLQDPSLLLSYQHVFIEILHSSY